MKSSFVYSAGYDIHLPVFDLLHPFDGRKFSKAWQKLLSISDIENRWIEPEIYAEHSLLSRVHSSDYLDSLTTSKVIARIVEIPALRFIPNNFLQHYLLKPIRLGCFGTVLATESAIRHKSLVMNFAGGYHHAFYDHGEGFCFFADAQLAIVSARESRLLYPDDKILMIDLDAHRGNGFDSYSLQDPAIHNFDMYNFQVYPGLHQGDPDEWKYMIPLKAKTKDQTYQERLRRELISFLDENQDAKLIFYNAGNDILESDPLGGLALSIEGVEQRDKFVVNEVVNRDIPAVVMTSGGYSSNSYKLIVNLARIILDITE